MDSADNCNEVESSGLIDDQAGPAQNAFRVLSVAEINCSQKRKLPTWMTNNGDDSAKKARNTRTRSACNKENQTVKATTSARDETVESSNQEDDKENETVNATTSAIDETVGSSHQEDDSNDNPTSPPSYADILEIKIEESKIDLQVDGSVQNGNCLPNGDDGSSSSHEENKNELNVDNSAQSSSHHSPQNIDAAVVKEEEEDSDDSEPSSSTVAVVATPRPNAIKKQVKVEKNEATSTTQRDCCQYGIRCYRRNPAHRVEMAHPGDPDYRLPDYLAPPLGTPSCPYGIKCYRRNPVHFRDFSHPPSTDPEKNWKRRLRQLKKKNKNSQNVAADNDDKDDYDLDDPFIDDDSLSEYSPSDSEDDDESD